MNDFQINYNTITEYHNLIPPTVRYKDISTHNISADDYFLTNDTTSLKTKIKQLETRVQSLETRLQTIEDMILYAPGGTIANKAKINFDQTVKQLKTVNDNNNTITYDEFIKSKQKDKIEDEVNNQIIQAGYKIKHR